VNIADIAGEIARRAVPTLHEVQQVLAVGRTMAAGAISAGALVDTAVDVGDIAGVLKDAAQSNKRADGAARALQAASAHARVAGQLGFDLVRVRIEVSKAEAAVRTLKSPAAASALVFLQPSLRQAQSAFESERFFQRNFRDIAVKLQNGGRSAVGEAALAAEKLASKSVIGRGLLTFGRVLTKPLVANTLMAVGVGVASIKGYDEAPTQSERWKMGYGAAGGAVSWISDKGLTVAVAAGRLNPAALLFDPAVKYGAKAFGEAKLGDQLTIGSFYEGCSNTIISLTQALTTGDSAPMNEVHKQHMTGNGNKVMQGYSMLGDAFSRTGLVDTALTKTADWYNDVPEDIRTSSSWWDGLSSDASALGHAGRGAVITVVEKGSDWVDKAKKTRPYGAVMTVVEEVSDWVDKAKKTLP